MGPHPENSPNLDQLKTARHGNVLWVELHNPPSNMFTLKMTIEIERLIRDIERAGEVRVVVFTGGVDGRFIEHFDATQILRAAERFERLGLGSPPPGTVYALGRLFGLLLDIAPAFGDRLSLRLAESPMAGLVLTVRFARLLARMENSPLLFIAAISGNCGGGAFEFACSCDFRFIERRQDIRLGHPESLVAMIPSGGGCQRLSRIVGPARAASFILDGRPMNVDEALALGLVSDAFPRDVFREKVQAHAARLACRAPQANLAIKRLIYRGSRLPYATALAQEQKAVYATGATKDSLLGLRAYLTDSGDPAVEARKAAELYEGKLVSFRGE
ncbi:MAG: enoyl-CoA hydratase/isomerase family protein [Nitrospirae bacterium]|nr:enoyl-CoA hydratase/isomerase family protein [Nitrospirota bacterium]